MTPIEAGKLLIHAAAFDNRKPSKAANHAWAEALHDLPADADAYAAVSRYYAEAPRDGELEGGRWIQPHHVRVIRRRIRDERIPDGAFTYPLPAGDETGGEFVRRRREQLRAIGDGVIQAEPILQLKGGPHPTVAAALGQVGQMPAEAREALAAVYPRRAERETGHVNPLAVACDWCQAEKDKPCKRRRPGKGDRDGTWFRRDKPHPSRVDAAITATVECPACQAGAGVTCRTETGQLYPGVHPQRAETVQGRPDAG